MKKATYFLFLCSIILIVNSCSSGHLAYKRGDYYKASLEAIDHLRTSPSSEKSQFVLTKYYPLALKTAMREIDNANLTNDQNKYDILVNQYERIGILADAIYRCPKANEMIPNPTEYQLELKNAKQMAAENAYEQGIKALNVGTVEQARLAYTFFQDANNYVYGYKDVLNKIEDARYYATYRILVQKPVTNANYQYSADFFYNNLMSELVRNTGKRLVRFYTPEEAYRENMTNPHQYLVLDFQSFTVGNIRENSSTTELKCDSVIVGTVTVEGKSYNSYATVKARLTTMNREILSNGVLGVSIIDAISNRTLQQRSFTGEFIWKDSWSNYNGDDRALSTEQKNKCQQKPQIPPSQQDMFVEFTKPIYNQALPYLSSFYSKY